MTQERMPAISSLGDLFLHTLKDVLYAERKILRNLPRMARNATDPVLKAALSDHAQETEDHVVRLERVFGTLGQPARGSKCDAMAGLFAESDCLMSKIDDSQTMDCALISLGQAIEHYEIARYGALIGWAQKLGWKEAAVVLGSTLDEERAADRGLARMAANRPTTGAAI